MRGRSCGLYGASLDRFLKGRGWEFGLGLFVLWGDWGLCHVLGGDGLLEVL